MRRRGCGIGQPVTSHAVRLVHGKGQAGVQRTAYDQRIQPGQPLAGMGQHRGQPRHYAAHDHALAGGGVHFQPRQQKPQLGGVFVRRTAGPRDHAGGKQDVAVRFARQPADADVAVADVDC